MQKIYSLLRNNKQSGPYSLEELLQLNLKPFDLVWIEGKSGGWSYPSEIDALKIDVPETSKPAEKKEAATTTPTTLAGNYLPETASNEFDSKLAKTIASEPKTQHIYISLPAGTQIAKPKSASFSSPQITEEESPEAKLERKALELRNKIQAFSQNKNLPKADNDLDTKYSRSLDDIKEEYSSWLYQQQKKKNVFSKKSVLVVAGVVFLLIAGYFLIPIVLSSKTDNTNVLSAQEIAASKPVFAQPDKLEKASDKSESAHKASKKTKKINATGKATYLSSKTYAPNAKIAKIDNYIDSLKSAENKKKAQTEEVVYEIPSTASTGSRQRTKRNDEAEANPTTVSKKETDSTPFTELIKLSESTGNGTPHLSLYNNSNKDINFVAIDVYYYKANKKLLQKKTLYFNRISAKSSAKLFVPQEKNAAAVRYEMGLIGTDDGLYYAKQ